MPVSRRQFLRTSAAGSAFSLAGAASGLGRLLADENANDKEKDRALLDPKMLRSQLAEMLGGPWPKRCPLRPQITDTRQEDGYTRHTLSYEAEPGDRIPAMLLVPTTATETKPAPAVAVWHQHNGQYHLGKSEPAGLAGNPMHHTGAALAKEGYVVLCPDALCFEERQDPTGKLKGGNFERFEFLRYVVDGKCMAWKNILDMQRAIDYLVTRPEVRSDAIGCYGHSMGSTHTWLVGPWEPRLKCLVGNCCLPTYQGIHRERLLHCFPNFIPGLARVGDTPDLAGLIAPRPLLLNFGEKDGGSPIEDVRRAVPRIQRYYQAAGAEDHFRAFIEPGVGHVLSPAMWEQTKSWLDRHLR